MINGIFMRDCVIMIDCILLTTSQPAEYRIDPTYPLISCVLKAYEIVESAYFVWKSWPNFSLSVIWARSSLILVSMSSSLRGCLGFSTASYFVG
jgi:hypothetical protein